MRAGGGHAGNQHGNFSFSRVHVLPPVAGGRETPRQPGFQGKGRSPIALTKSALTSDKSENDIEGTNKPGVDEAQSLPTPTGADSPAPIPTDTAESKPTMSVSGDSYTDGDDCKSEKLIKFTVTVPSGQSKTDWALVNWLQGEAKNADGSFRKVTMYGKTVDYNFPSMQVDSVDTDPIYWSTDASRWNYNVTDDKFWATDSPGPTDKKYHGITYDLKFKMGLYKVADLPATTSGDVGSAKPVAEYPWNFKVSGCTDGKVSH